MIELILVSKLQAITPKVYPLKAPESASGTFVVYRRSSTDYETHLSGPSGITYPEFQIDVYSTSYSVVANVSDSIIAALDGLIDGDIMYCSVENNFDMEADPEEDGYYRHVIMIKFTFRG